jgi:hypothetical protein
MGRKRIGPRQRLYFCIAGLICFLLAGCSFTKPAVETPETPGRAGKPAIQDKAETPPPPAAGGTKPPVSVPEGQQAKAAAEQLRRARKFLAHKDFEASLKVNQRVLTLAGKQPPADEALFNLGLIYIHAENPKRDYGKSMLYFQRLVKEFPESFWAEDAKTWVGILQENEKLRDMIEKAKQVDITVDEKKREIAR